MIQNLIVLPNLQCVYVESPPKLYAMSNFAQLIGADHTTTPFRQFVRSAGYRCPEYHISNKKGKNTRGFGKKNEARILDYTTQNLGISDFKRHQKVKRGKLYGVADAVTKESVIEIKTSSSFSHLSNEELKHHILTPNINAVWQAAIYAYTLGKDSFIIVYYYPTEEDYRTGSANHLEDRLFVYPYTTNINKRTIENGLSYFDRLVARMDQGYTPCYNTYNQGDMDVVASIINQQLH